MSACAGMGEGQAYFDRSLFSLSSSGEYPEVAPSVQVSLECPSESRHLTYALEKCCRENRGSPMLYNLVSRTIEVRPPVVEPAEEVVVVERVPCPYFLRGVQT